MPETKTKVDAEFHDEVLDRFCLREQEPDRCQELLLRPFSDERFAFASDTHALCFRALRDDEPRGWALNDGRPPNAAAVLGSYGVRLGDAYELALPALPLAPCAECEGMGRATKTVVCYCCRGSGECECPDCGMPHECGECHGLGKFINDSDCEACQGQGVTHAGEAKRCLRFGGLVMQRKYIFAVSQVPDVRVRIWRSEDQKISAFLFSGDGYAGVVSPIEARNWEKYGGVLDLEGK
jgi:hypothetical protein